MEKCYLCNTTADTLSSETYHDIANAEAAYRIGLVTKDGYLKIKSEILARYYECIKCVKHSVDER